MYKVTGKISKITEVQPIGDQYQKLTFVVTNNDGYEGAEKDYALEIFEKSDGEKCANFIKYNKVGKNVEVSFDIRSSESKGRYFTSLSAFRIDKAEGSEDAPTESTNTPDDSSEVPF